MNDVERLLAIEEINQLKAKYFYGLDHKDWDYWREEVWAPDARLEIAELDKSIEPREELIAFVAKGARGWVSVHHGHTPIIEITSSTTAKAIWAMEDRLYLPPDNLLYGDTCQVIAFGHYHENYVKLDVGWRIISTRLTRLRSNDLKVS